MGEHDESSPGLTGPDHAKQDININVPHHSRYCLNCHTALTDIYCPHCGQKDIPRRQTLTELSFNFFSSFSGYESRFLKRLNTFCLSLVFWRLNTMEEEGSAIFTLQECTSL